MLICKKIAQEINTPGYIGSEGLPMPNHIMSDIWGIQQDKHEKTHQQKAILGQNPWALPLQNSPTAAMQNSGPSLGSSIDYCSSSYMAYRSLIE